MKDKQSLRDLCREVGVSHLQTVEVMRRIRERVIEQDMEVITQTVGTFYASAHKARVRKLNGVLYQVPAKVVVALRGPRFPGRVQRLLIRDFGVQFIAANIKIVDSFEQFSDEPIEIETTNSFSGNALDVQYTVKVTLINLIGSGIYENEDTPVDTIRIQVSRDRTAGQGPMKLFDVDGSEIDSGDLAVDSGEIEISEKSYFNWRPTPFGQDYEFALGRDEPFVLDDQPIDG